MINIDELKFDEKGLIPAVIIDSVSKKVLTVAYMNKESLKISMEKGLHMLLKQIKTGTLVERRNKVAIITI